MHDTIPGPVPQPGHCGQPRHLSVLLVNSLYAPQAVGGAEAVTEMLATTLARQGHKVTVVTSCSRQEGCVTETRDGVHIHRFFPPNLWWLNERFVPGDTRSSIARLRWRLRDAWNVSAGRRFAGILDRIRPDVVHTHNIKGFSPTLWRATRRRGIPLVHTAHSYEIVCATGLLMDGSGRVCPPRPRCLQCRAQGRWYGAHARAINVFCSPSRYLLNAHLEAGVPLRRFAVVRNGFHPPSTPPVPRNRPDGPVRLLYLGQLSRHKGIGTLAEAVRRCGAPFQLDVAGQGDAAESIRQLARTDARVRYHGFVDGAGKHGLLQSADALIFPSIWVENAPMSIAEAMCHGVPVVASDIGALREAVEPGVNGSLVKAGDPQALAAEIAALCTDRGRLRTLQSGAARAGLDVPTPDAMAADYLRIYHSLPPSAAEGERA